MKVVISQPMFFPWRGYIELISSADIIVMYDDIQFSKGSFTNRVQIKGSNGKFWLTAPIKKEKNQKALIKDLIIFNKKEWGKILLKQIISCLNNTPHFESALQIVKEVINDNSQKLSTTSWNSTNCILKFFNKYNKTKFVKSDGIANNLSGYKRVIEILNYLKADTYISALGGKFYLPHEEFEKKGIEVKYPIYDLSSYPQKFGSFDPYVSSLDLIANVGRSGLDKSSFILKNWREH